jgi:hypothetical protein
MEKQCNDINNNDAESNSDEGNHTPTKKKDCEKEAVIQE